MKNCHFVLILLILLSLYTNKAMLGQGNWEDDPSNPQTWTTGKVGIGTINPAFQLSLGSSIARTKLALYETGADNSYGLGVVSGAFRLHLAGSGARFAFFDSDEADANEIFTIQGKGNVGIGKKNPTAKLHVEGNVVLGTGGGKVGIGMTKPAFQLSLGSSTARTKLALYETGADNSYGLGVVPGAFRLHLNGSGARFAFFDSDEADANEIFTIHGNGKTRVQVLQITGGSDLAEPFEIAGAESITPGMIVSIDPEHPGQLLIADKAYDRTVAGIVSGANGLNPGLTMKQKGSAADGTFPVALTGRVYCWANASNGSIQPGDLLTTSDIPGHAMKVTDYAKAQGAIIGKAMGSLETGRGLILVLVTLQ